MISNLTYFCLSILPILTLSGGINIYKGLSKLRRKVFVSHFSDIETSSISFAFLTIIGGGIGKYYDTKIYFYFVLWC